jgi:hypothetical protein
MRVSFGGILSLCCAAACGLGLASSAQAIVVDGSLDGAYGAALAVQTINSGFGDSIVGDGTSAGGSELDAAYGVMCGGNLHLFLSGNHEDNGNQVNVFIAGGAAGQSTLAVPLTSQMQNMNGSVFSPGFQATFALNTNDWYDSSSNSWTDYVEEYTLTGTPSGGYVGSFPLTGGIGSGILGLSTIGDNNTNAAGVNGNSGTAASAAAAQAVFTGWEVSIPLSAIGYTGGAVKVLACINGYDEDYLSNQFLPGLPVGTGNVGAGGPYAGVTAGAFNFGSTPGEYFTVRGPGDANGDGRVDINDLTIVLTNYGQSGHTWSQGCMDGDPIGMVDINDLTIVLTDYGKTYGAAGIRAVPEPSTPALIGVGVASLLAFAWRRRGASNLEPLD